MKTCKKPIFPILPSIINVKEEIADFINNKHRINFPEECVFGNALCKIYNTPKPQPENVDMPAIDVERIRLISTEWFGTSMSARHILGLEKVPRVRLFAD